MTHAHTTDRTAPGAASPLRTSPRGQILAALVGPAVLVSLLLTYLLAPDFYLTWVLHFAHREHQVVEFVTVVSAAIAGVLLLIAGLRLWRHQAALGDPNAVGLRQRVGQLVRQRGGAAIVLTVALASLFLAGEEISWGQTYLQWETPERYANLSVETNLHNAPTPISIQGLGGAFLLATFIGLPMWWRWRDDRLPRSWAAAIPEWPVAVTVATAFAWKEYKSIYRVLYDHGEQASRFYIDFVEQINEHKEMIAAIALLMYALYRLPAVARAIKAGSATKPVDMHP